MKNNYLFDQKKQDHYHCFSFGALAQLVERNNGIVEVNGSTPLRSNFLFSFSGI